MFVDSVIVVAVVVAVVVAAVGWRYCLDLLSNFDDKDFEMDETTIGDDVRANLNDLLTCLMRQDCRLEGEAIRSKLQR